MQAPPYLTPLLLTALLAALLGAVLWRRRKAPGATPLAFLMASVVWWTLAYMVSLSVTSIAAQLFWSNIAYVGIVLAPVCWFAFALSYTGASAALTHRRIALLLLVPLLTLLVIATNDFHGLFRRQVFQATSDGFVILDAALGPYFWFHTAYSYLLLLSGSVLLLHNLLHLAPYYRTQAGGLLIGVATPWISNTIYLGGLSPYPYLDLTPFALLISGVAITWDIVRLDLFGIVPIAYNTVFQSMEDGVLVLNDQAQIVDLNPAAALLLAHQPQALIGTPFSHAFPDGAAAFAQCRQQAPSYTEVFLSDPDSVRSFDLRVTPIHDRHKNVKGHVLILQESTKRKQAANALRRQNEELLALATENGHLYQAVQQELAERKQIEAALILAKESAEIANRAKSRFLANMSHELRTPLTAILGYSDMVAIEAHESGYHELEKDLAAIQGAGQHLLRLINDILDLTRIEAEKFNLHIEPFVLADLIDQVADTISPLIAKNNNTFTVEKPDDCGIMQSDSTRVRQILLNILGNATKFTENGSISLRLLLSEETQTNASALITFIIRDSGIGMNLDQQHKLFQDFVQIDDSTTRKYGGSGLGLAITYRLCKLMGGAIHVSSAPGVGSTFTIELPRHTLAQQQSIQQHQQHLRGGVEVDAVDRRPLGETLQPLVATPLPAEGVEQRVGDAAAPCDHKHPSPKSGTEL